MQSKAILKSMGAVLLAIALLVGMLSVVGTLPLFSVAETPEKFTADFGAMATGVENAGGEDWEELQWEPNTGDVKSTTMAYTNPNATDATDADKYAAQYMGDRFDTVTMYADNAPQQLGWYAQAVSAVSSSVSGAQDSSCFRLYKHATVLGGGKWLFYHFNKAGPQPVEMLRVNTSNVAKHGGKRLLLKNFEAELEFAFRDADRAGAVMISFHEAVGGEYTWLQKAENIGHTGNTVVVGNGGEITNDGWNFYTKNEELNSKTITPNGGNGVRFGRTLVGEWFTLKVRAVNGTATITLTDAAGEPVATALTKTYATADGNISFGASDRGVFFKTFTITELNSQGEAVDIGTYYDEKMYTGGDAYPDGKTRFEAYFAALIQHVPAFSGGYYTPTTNDTELHAYVNERFGLLYNNQAFTYERKHLGERSIQFDTTEKDTWGGDSYWRVSENGSLLRWTSRVGGEMMRKHDMLVVKAPNGNYASLKNFEATYQVQDALQGKGSVTLSFRNSVHNQVTYVDGINANAQVLVRPEQEVVIIGVDNAGKTGITFGSGTDHGRGPTDDKNNTTYNYIDTEIPALAGISDYTVTVKALNDKLTVSIVGGNGALIWDNTANPYTLKRQDAGYMSLSVSNSSKAIRSLVVTQLDGNGNVVDFGTGTRAPVSEYDAENTVYYDFSTAEQLEDFDTYFLPTLTKGNKLIPTTGTANTNWKLENDALKFQKNTLYRDPSNYKEPYTFTEDPDQKWSFGFPQGYNSNYGFAVLKTKQYKNFILDYDFVGSRLWTVVGFGAKNTADGSGVYYTTKDGGCTFLLEYDGGKGAVDFNTFEKSTRVAGYFEYNATGTHHMRIIVSNGKAYMSLDDQEAWVMDVPAGYNGGHLFFGSTDEGVSIDNVKVTDLDAKAIKIDALVGTYEDVTIDRAAGETLSLPKLAYGIDENGYEYPVHVTFKNDEYRSYKNGNFAFEVGLDAFKNMSLTNRFDVSLNVVNNINGDFDDTVSKKYYFDHPNDFKDFGAYYSEYAPRANYWTVKDDPNPNDYWTAFDGKLTSTDPAKLWKVNTDGNLLTAQTVGKAASSPVERMRNISTMVLKDVNLMNFRLEMDVKQSAMNYWYSSLLIGVQDPTCFYTRLGKNTEGALSTGHETGFRYDERTAKGGVWAFLEQEGYFNVVGNMDGGQTQRITNEPLEFDFIKSYDKTQWHHFTIEVVNGVMMFKVDDSLPLYFNISYDAYGGLVGFANYNNGGLFDNFQITALDEDGNEVPFEDGERGWKLQGGTVSAHLGWDPVNKPWAFDWDKRHKE